MKSNSGNVLFLILIAVALFAALSYAVTSSSRGGGIDAKKDSSELIASEIMNYVSSLEQAVTRLRVSNGCSLSQISFENSVDINYTNTFSRTDKSCNVFHQNGGGMYWKKANQNWFVGTSVASTYASYQTTSYGQFYFPNSICVLEVGTGVCPPDGTGNELVVGLAFLTEGICQAINDRLGTTMNVIVGSILGKGDNSQRYRGQFPSSPMYAVLEATGQRTACMLTSKTGYTFYHVLEPQ